MRTSLYDYCVEHDRPGLLREWHPTKNAPLMPEGISYGSKRRVWWKCEKGHEWRALISSRTSGGAGCPYCAGKAVIPGENDLASQFPEIAAQWHPTLNGALTPEMVTARSHRKVWWECPSGHIWKAVIYSRAGPQKCGCPVCAGKVRPERAERYRLALTEHSQRAAGAALREK